MEWIDAHCHLHDPWFTHSDISDLESQFIENNIKYIINCASEPKHYDFVTHTAKQDRFYITLGIQPTIALDAKHMNLLQMYGNYIDILKDKFVGIGEVGLDYYWVKDEKQREIQREVFTQIIKLANELNQKLIIHSRKAETDCLTLLEKYAQVPVLLHSFDGNLKETERAMDLGYKISIPTNLTIRKNRRKTAIRAGLENIMLETDSPFCAVSEDIKRNDPSQIPIAGKYLVKLFELPIEEISHRTTQNAVEYYKLSNIT
jgi:TatD DNase family protein